MQENWIGKSTGAEVKFRLEGRGEPLTIFTTRPDTLYGASFLALSPDHPLAEEVGRSDPALAAFIAECRSAGTSEAVVEAQEKRGYETPLQAIHPLQSDQRLPVYVANFVLMEYGAGAIFGCPAHDQRDLDFARKYALPVIPVVCPPGEDPETFAVGDTAFTDDGLLINSDFLNGMDVESAKKAVGQRLRELKAGEPTMVYRLRDWLVSRQRYWGCPIPVIHCEGCGIQPVPRGELPVLLPDDVSFDKPGNPLDRHPTWKQAVCPKCGKPARRETDTFDTFVDSSWYFARFCSPAGEGAGGTGGGELLAAGGSVYRRRRACDPASALFPLLHPRHEQERAFEPERALRRPVHPGHGDCTSPTRMSRANGYTRRKCGGWKAAPRSIMRPAGR